MTLEMAMVDADTGDLFEAAAAQPHDPGFVPFVRRAQAAGIPVEVVSRRVRLLHRAGARGARRRRSSRSSRRGRPSRAGRPRDRLSRTATRRASCAGPASAQRVLEHQAAGRAVVFIGDGESDRYAAGYSDVVFAKRSLVRICLRGRLAVPALDRVRRDRRLADRDRSTPGGRIRRRCPCPARAAVLLRPGGLGRRASRTRRPGTGRQDAERRLVRRSRGSRFAIRGRLSDSIRKTPGGPDPWRSMSL